MKRENTYIVVGLLEKELHRLFEDVAKTYIELSDCKEEDKETINEHLIISVKCSKRLIECINEIKELQRKGE